MPRVTALQTRLLAHLKRRHAGKPNAISSRALEARFSVSGATVRRAVLALRRAGEPICSDSGGYYYSACTDEVWDTIGKLERRAKGTFRVTRGMRRAATAMPGSGQTCLETGGDGP